MNSSDIDSEYITRRTTVTPAMANDIAALKEEVEEQAEDQRVEREARANQASSPSPVRPGHKALPT